MVVIVPLVDDGFTDEQRYSALGKEGKGPVYSLVFTTMKHRLRLSTQKRYHHQRTGCFIDLPNDPERLRKLSDMFRELADEREGELEAEEDGKIEPKRDGDGPGSAKVVAG